MAKKNITDTLDINWQEKLQDKTKEEALEWISTNVPDGYTLGYYYGYECSTYGKLEFIRLETDEEEQTREAREAEIRASNKRKEDAKILRRAKIIECTAFENLLLKEYLIKHKDNPRINDLENLKRAQLQFGPGYSEAVIKQVEDMLEEIENG